MKSSGYVLLLIPCCGHTLDPDSLSKWKGQRTYPATRSSGGPCPSTSGACTLPTGRPLFAPPCPLAKCPNSVFLTCPFPISIASSIPFYVLSSVLFAYSQLVPRVCPLDFFQMIVRTTLIWSIVCFICSWPYHVPLTVTWGPSINENNFD